MDRLIEKSTPQEIMLSVAEHADMMSVFSSRAVYPHPSGLKPGQSYMSLSAAVREKLKNLKSDDLKNVRWPLWK